MMRHCTGIEPDEVGRNEILFRETLTPNWYLFAGQVGSLVNSADDLLFYDCFYLNPCSPAMSEHTVTLPAAEFIAICRGLSAAGRGFANKTVFLHFKPKTLEIEGDMGGGTVETDGEFYAQVRVSCRGLAGAASLHRKRAAKEARLQCVLDPELGEIRLPLSGVKAKFDG